MKPYIPLLAAVAAVAAAVAILPQPVLAQQSSGTPADKAVQSPLGRRCVVTLDPNEPGKVRVTQSHGADKYQLTDNKVEGDLIQIDADWLILKDGNYENWVPRDKVLFMRVSR